MDSERRNFFKKEIADASAKKKRRKEDSSRPVMMEKSVQRRDSDVLILGSQSYNAQNKDLSILDSKSTKKSVCEKLFTSEVNNAIPIQKEREKKKENETTGNTTSNSEAEDRSKLIYSEIMIEIEPEDVEVENIPSLHNNLETTHKNKNVTQSNAANCSDGKNVSNENEPSYRFILCETITTAKHTSDVKNKNISEDEPSSKVVVENSKPEEPKDEEKSNTMTQNVINKDQAIIHCELVTTDTELATSEDKNESTVHQTQIDKMNRKAIIHSELVITDTDLTTNEDNNLESEISELNLHSTLTEIIPEKEMDMIRKSLEEHGDMCQDNNELSVSPEAKKKRKKSARKAMNKSYVDFLSEEEDFVWDSTSWKETGSDSDSSSTKTETPRKKKKKLISEDGKVGEAGLKKKRINKKKLRYELRKKGKSYVKKDGSVVNEKELKPNPCLGKKCGHNCGQIDEEKRINIFNYFWGLSPQGKKDWIVAMLSSQEVKRKRSKSSAYRSRTYNYFINDGEGRRQVCLKFILNTLDITQKYVQYTLSTASYGIAKEESRGKFIPSNKTREENKDSARNLIKGLPALPSHYCRKDSTRLYLPVEFKNIKNLYRIYKETKSSEGVDCISEKLFRNIFHNEFNLGFHIPKKDKCLKCLKFEAENENDCPEKKAHLEEKKASKARLECHRELVKDNPSILCTSFDLQKVLNTPHGSNMQLYYSRKYAVYNLCFYESVTRSGFCYIWGESEGNRGANEIATILQKYVKDVDARGSVKTLILYSDSCPGQNKNKIVLAALHNALLQSQNLETIQMNYLLPGHTEMTVDSIHSTIENSVRNTTVWAPSQWVTICQVARKEPRPYNVEGLIHEDFKSFDDLADKYFKGNLVGKISKLRIATFKKSAPNTMKVKYSMKEDSPDEKIQIVAKPKLVNQRYTSSLPITKAKYKDLKKLCDSSVIPRIFHSEYLSLNSSDGNDELIDTDVEDEVDVE